MADLAAPEELSRPPNGRARGIGIDLGGAPNMEVLRERWAAVKANFGPLLTGLHPLAARDRKPGSTELRLVVGPMPNLAAAQASLRPLCRRPRHLSAAKFDGDSRRAHADCGGTAQIGIIGCHENLSAERARHQLFC